METEGKHSGLEISFRVKLFIFYFIYFFLELDFLN